jgi:hypothetical protein
MPVPVAATKLTQAQIDILYEILERFDTVCSEINMQYLLCGGTALGAIRHKGLIPWDDDGDIFMFSPQFYNKSMELFITATKHGLHIRPFEHKNGVESDGWYKIYLGAHTIPNVDIFVMQHRPETDQWVNIDPKAQEFFPNDYLTSEQMSSPPYRTTFGPLDLWMFPNHTPYFDRNYGNDWNIVAWDGYDHVNDIWKRPRSNEPPVRDYRPALPTKKVKFD